MLWRPSMAALCYLDGVGPPRYAFVHGNFALGEFGRWTQLRS